MSDKKTLSTMGGVKSDGRHDNPNDYIENDIRKPKNKGVSAQSGFVGASFIDDRPALSENELLVHEALLAEAEEEVCRRMKKGKKREEAIKEVSNELEMTPHESTELTGRVKKTPKLTFKEQPAPTPAAPDNSIIFESAEDAESALGILMYRSVPWSSKGVAGNNSFIQFNDANSINEAQEVLRRRYDFVESDTRKIGNIQFDNLADYSKVMEFMQRTGMLVEFKGDTQLDEDYDEIQARKVVERKKAKKTGKLIEDAVEKETRSFTAKNRKKIKETVVNPMIDSSFRQAVVRRRWK
jgi:hypothetical protein